MTRFLALALAAMQCSIAFSLSSAEPPVPRTTAGADGEPKPEEDPNNPQLELERQRAAARIGSRLTRGPYLQLGTPDSVVVRWRTDVASASSVRFGLGLANLKFTARGQGALVEHIVQLTNLLPATRYFYALSTNTFTGTGSNSVFVAATNSFVTAPVHGGARPARIWVLGDPGTRKPVQKAVRDGFYKFNGGRHPDLWLLLGDNAYTAGKDDEYQAGIFAPYRDTLRSVPLWPCLGNHDGGSANSATQSGIYYDIFTLPTMAQAGGVMSGTEAYFSYDYANAHFVALDSYDSDRSTNGAMRRWLRADLAANKQMWTIAYWHHPPHSRGSHDTDLERDGDKRCREMREGICPTLEAGGADLILCGHSHAYERSWFMDGFYSGSTNFSYARVKNSGDGRLDGDGPYRKRSFGPAPHEGTVYLVAGSSGQMSGVKAAHPVMQLALNIAGSVVVDVDGPRLDVAFVDDAGVRRDYFTLLKGDARPGPAGRERLVGGARRDANDFPGRLRRLLDTPGLDAITNALAADQPALLRAYTNSTDAAQRARLIWALAAIGDAAIAKQFTIFVTNKVKGRVLTAEEEDARLTTLQALGLLATRYEPALDVLRKGISADWWYFRTNWISSRPLEQTAADLETCTIQALGLSGRAEAGLILSNTFKRYKQFTAGEPEILIRDYAAEITTASNRLSQSPALGPIAWPRRILTREAPRLERVPKSDE
jgi:hypothetical protein